MSRCDVSITWCLPWDGLAGPPADAAPVVRHQIGSIASNLPIEHVRTISDVLDKAIAQERLMSVIALFLGALVIAIDAWASMR